jgi:hypothetical protein
MDDIAEELVKVAKELVGFYDENLVGLVTDYNNGRRYFGLEAPEAIGYSWRDLSGNERERVDKEKKRAVKILKRVASDYAKFISDVTGADASVEKYPTGLGYMVKFPYKMGLNVGADERLFVKKVTAIMKKYGVRFADSGKLGELR